MGRGLRWPDGVEHCAPRDRRAEPFATIYPRRAALIRSVGDLPGKPDFDISLPGLVHIIVIGSRAARARTSRCTDLTTRID